MQPMLRAKKLYCRYLRTYSSADIDADAPLRGRCTHQFSDITCSRERLHRCGSVAVDNPFEALNLPTIFPSEEWSPNVSPVCPREAATPDGAMLAEELVGFDKRVQPCMNEKDAFSHEVSRPASQQVFQTLGQGLS